MTQPTIAQIKQAVAEHFGMRLIDMNAYRSMRCVARPRQIAMYLSRELTEHSLPAIGRAFNRHHTTIMHGISQIDHILHDSSISCPKSLVEKDIISAAIEKIIAKISWDIGDIEDCGDMSCSNYCNPALGLLQYI